MMAQVTGRFDLVLVGDADRMPRPQHDVVVV